MQGQRTLLYIGVMQALIFLVDIFVSFPSSWPDLTNKLITLLWPLVYSAVWLASLRFPFKYAYFLPLVLVIVNTITLWTWVSRTSDLDQKTPETVSLIFIYCSLGQMWDTLVLTSFVAPSLGSVCALLVADIVTRFLHYELAWKDIVDDNQQEWIFQFIAYAYGSFLLFEVFFFIILQKSQLAQYFSFKDLEKKQI